MKESLLDIPFPTGGLVVNTALEDQPPATRDHGATTPLAINVRTYDELTGRSAGGQRAGMTKYCPDRLVGNYPIQTLDQMVYTGQSVQAKAGAVGFLAFADNQNTVGLQIYDQPTTTLSTYNGSLTSPACLGCCWDQSGNAYGILKTGTDYQVVSIDAKAKTQRWLSSALGATVLTAPSGIAYGNGSIWVVVCNTGNTAVFLYKLDAATGVISTGTHLYTTSRSLQPVASLTGEVPASVLSYCNGVVAFGLLNGYVIFYNTISSAATEIQIQAANTPFTMGIDTDGLSFFYIASLQGQPATPTASWITKVDLKGTQQWQKAMTNNAILGVSYDPYLGKVLANFYFNAATFNWATYNSDTGALVNSYARDPAGGALNTIMRTIIPDGTGAYLIYHQETSQSAAFDSIPTDNGTRNWTKVYLSGGGGGGDTTGTTSFAACRTTVAFDSILAPRSVRAIGVSAGTVVRFTTKGVLTISSAALSPGAYVIWSAQLADRLYFADGVHYKYYDGTLDTVATLTATAGSLPSDSQGNKARLVASWRGRIVWSGLRYDARNWFMSAQDAPADYDYKPVPSSETQAIDGNNSTTGLCPDIINSLMQYSDDVLLFGGDHSIYQMSGNPMAGGRLDLITDTIGVAWGRPYCKDAQGTLYFLSTRGSVYQYQAGGKPQLLSDAISSLLSEIKSGTQIVRMAWNEEVFGFHIWISDAVTAQTAAHYFYDVRNSAWFQDKYANLDLNPVAAHVFDGNDPGDRVVLLGGRDGYVRKLDEAALDDDGTAIASSVMLGPFRDKRGGGLTLCDLQCSLARTSGGITYEIFAGEDAQAAFNSMPAASGTFVAGRNRSQAVRVFGHALYVKLSSDAIGSSWQLEWLRSRMRMSEGKARQRIF